ncbi:hypothetical protein OF83DRAFT_6651 [Amylostereum chailletii]|nr:hypothetical protein OF83DRAFT_6651 [Amylostereum chailletii]
MSQPVRLAVVQSNHQGCSQHWALAAIHSDVRVRVFEISAVKGGFRYYCQDVPRASVSLQHSCVVGDVDLKKLDWVRDALSEVPIPRGHACNCQSWTWNAVQELRKAQGRGVGILSLEHRAVAAVVQQGVTIDPYGQVFSSFA